LNSSLTYKEVKMDRKFDRIDLNEFNPPRIERPKNAEQVASRISEIMLRFDIKEPWDLQAQIDVPIQLIWQGLELLLEKGKIEVVPGQDISERSKRCQFRWITGLP
jgi:hypothetical protein